jgi:hypothetical protein
MSTITLPSEEKVDEVAANLSEAAMVAQAGVAQVVEIAAGGFQLEEPLTRSQLAVLHMLSNTLENEGKEMMTGAYRLRDALLKLDGMRREAQLTKGGGEDDG